VNYMYPNKTKFRISAKRRRCPQEGLKALKEQWGSQLKLKRTSPSASADAPFPVNLMLLPEPPDSCSLFDQLECLTLHATINKGFLAMSEGSAPAPLWHVLSIEIDSDQLPRSLSRAMTSKLRYDLATSAPSFCSGAKAARVILGVIRESFSMLLSSLPELLTLKPALLEYYESVGAAGNSERRMKFTPDTDEAEPPSSTVNLDPEAQSETAAVTAAQTKYSEQSSDASGRNAPPMHPSIAKMLRMLSTRFPDLKATYIFDRAQNPIDRDAEFASLIRFEVSVTPSDASWIHGSLQCGGTVFVSIQQPSHPTASPPQPSVTEKLSGGTTVTPEGPVGNRRPVRRPHVPVARTEAPPMTATLYLKPNSVVDLPTTALVNHMLRNASDSVAGVLQLPLLPCLCVLLRPLECEGIVFISWLACSVAARHYSMYIPVI
jgi:hypothetical protein